MNKTSETEILFYKIWRNSWIRNNIRDQTLKDITITVTIPHLLQNYQIYLKLANTVKIFLKVYQHHFDRFCNEFIEFPHRSLITDIEFDQRFFTTIPVGFIPDMVKMVVLGHEYNKPLEKGTLPDSVETLFFSYCFNQPLSADLLPSKLKTLVLGDKFNQFLHQDTFPQSLTNLDLGATFNHKLKPNVIPQNVTFLKLSKRCGYIDRGGVIPNTVTDLEFSGNMHKDQMLPPLKELKFLDFNRHTFPPGSLPLSIEFLKFGGSQTLYQSEYSFRGIIPPNTKSLYCGMNFHHPFAPGDFPESLVFASIGCDLVLAKGLLLGNLQHLKLGFYNQPLVQGGLPDSLTKLELGEFFNHPIEKDILPKGLKHLSLSNKFNQSIDLGVLPETLTFLLFNHSDVPPLPGVIPDNVKHLVFSKSFHSLLLPGVIPSGVEHLEFEPNEYMYQLSENVFPSGESLNHFTFKCPYTCLASYKLPSMKPKSQFKLTLEFNEKDSLVFGDVGQCPLPSNISDLTLLGFNGIIKPNVLQNTNNSLSRLDLGDSFNQPLSPNVIPHGIKTLYIGLSFIQHIPPNVIPTSVRSLFLPSSGYTLEIDSIPPFVNTLIICETIDPNLIPPSVPNIYWVAF
ncbi:hypothetical protein CYY_006790 [Polysphondylium violaceum]|uniref:FNIP repeat-containing protein n=1 Tax=Polysphondylium violaceum TaxID=133409 RepID=A0A8J4PQT5_9MYCE|nr:hypothetical protein CYY_006790 [Polysphondylium violaceum]